MHFGLGKHKRVRNLALTFIFIAVKGLAEYLQTNLELCLLFKCLQDFLFFSTKIVKNLNSFSLPGTFDNFKGNVLSIYISVVQQRDVPIPKPFLTLNFILKTVH